MKTLAIYAGSFNPFHVGHLNIVDKMENNFASHVSNCIMNPTLDKRKKEASERLKGKEIIKRLIINKICPECKGEFEIKATESQIRRDVTKKYCSRKCANKRIHSDETKIKMSKSSKGIIPSNKGIKKEITFTCIKCGEIGIDKKYKNGRKYHSECWNLSSGGFREGSSNCKKGWYKGYRCDSSYELAYLIFNIEHNNKIERNKDGFEYVFNDKKHLFYPDFIVNGEYVEIKNYRSELTDCKLKYFPTKIEIYYKDTMKPYLEYVIDKYGKDFIKLYEKALVV